LFLSRKKKTLGRKRIGFCFGNKIRRHGNSNLGDPISATGGASPLEQSARYPLFLKFYFVQTARSPS
ncbi:MAG: hypothetical protein AABY04_01185, partial [Candidatus Micrarchaeota archaeon]